MELDTAMQNNVTIVTLSGPLDFTTGQDVSQQLMNIVDNNKNIVINMGQCSYVSSSGLRILLLLGKRVKQLGDKAVLANLTEEVQDIMEMTGFGTIFQCFDDVDTAVRFVGEKAQ